MSTRALPPLSGTDVRARFNAIPSILFYTRAAHSLGLWASERILIERHFPALETALVEAGCGAGRVTLGLWRIGYTNLTAFDFAEELLDQARSLADQEGARSITFKNADATKIGLSDFGRPEDEPFGGALMMFNGLMQIPGRANRRKALRRLHSLCCRSAIFLFTTHDRGATTNDGWWTKEANRWALGTRDPRLAEFGDRNFEDESGEVFIHIPDRPEILEDLAATGWIHRDDVMRSEIAAESKAVAAFSDDCRFWVAERNSA